MKKAIFILLSFFMCIFLNAQTLPSFQSHIIHAPVGGTGLIDMHIADATTVNYPFHLIVTPQNQSPVITKDVTVPDVEIVGVPVGKFTLTMVAANGVPLGGSARIGVILPNGKVVFDTLIIQYPTPPPVGK